MPRKTVTHLPNLLDLQSLSLERQFSLPPDDPAITAGTHILIITRVEATRQGRNYWELDRQPLRGDVDTIGGRGNEHFIHPIVALSIERTQNIERLCGFYLDMPHL